MATGFCCAKENWQVLSPGIEYLKQPISLTPWSYLHVFRIQLKKNQLSLVNASRFGIKQAFIKELATKEQACIAVNGGFFDRQLHPLGLRVSGHQALNQLRKISWWGVFYIQEGQAYIKRSNRIPEISSMQFAVEGGPRLIIAGRIPALKLGRDERTALGITKTGEVILVVTENALLTTTELAELMLKPPISAHQAMNLDGGSSTQLYVNLPDLRLDLHGFSMVPDAIMVKPKFSL